MPRKILAALFAFLVLAFGTIACEASVEGEGDGEGGGVGVDVEGEGGEEGD